MKTQTQQKKPQTISEVCGKSAEAFQQLLATKKQALQKIRSAADARIMEDLGRKMAWVA